MSSPTWACSVFAQHDELVDLNLLVVIGGDHELKLEVLLKLEVKS
jgi:hypothetical protein